MSNKALGTELNKLIDKYLTKSKETREKTLDRQIQVLVVDSTDILKQLKSSGSPFNKPLNFKSIQQNPKFADIKMPSDGELNGISKEIASQYFDIFVNRLRSARAQEVTSMEDLVKIEQETTKNLFLVDKGRYKIFFRTSDLNRSSYKAFTRVKTAVLQEIKNKFENQPQNYLWLALYSLKLEQVLNYGGENIYKAKRKGDRLDPQAIQDRGNHGGFDFGHSFGALIYGQTGLLDDKLRHNLGNKVTGTETEEDLSKILTLRPALESIKDEEVKSRIKQLIARSIKADANLELERRVFDHNKEVRTELKFTYLFPELQNPNAASGAAAQKINKDLFEYLTSIAAEIEASPNHLDTQSDVFIHTWETLEGFDEKISKTKKPKSKRNAKAKKPHKIETKIYKVAKSITPKSPKSTPRIKDVKSSVTTSPPPDLSSVISYVNSKLHDQIKNKNMGRGGATELLNYRTGRFAHSAKLVRIDSVRGKTIEATVSYMKHPYNVFAPGGHLYKELRDPQLILRRSIRQLLTELISTNLNIRTRVE